MYTKSLLSGCLLVLFIGSEVMAADIQLKTGKWLQGEVVSTDREGLHFLRDDSTKLHYYPWDHLKIEISQELRNNWNLLQQEMEDEYDWMDEVEAVSVRLENGSILVAEFLEENEGVLRIARRGMEFHLPKEQIQSVTKQFVKPVEIYQENDLCGKFREKLQPKSGKDFKVYGDYCRQLGVYLEALRAYETASFIDPELNADLAPVVKALKMQAKNDILLHKYRKVRAAAMGRKDFEEAEALVEEIAELYPEEEELIEKIAEDVYKTREDWLRAVIPHHYFRHMHKECRRIARSNSLDEALAELNDLPPRVEEYVKDKLQIDEETFRSSWNSRNLDGRSVMLRMACFGAGTFLCDKTIPSAQQIGSEQLKLAKKSSTATADLVSVVKKMPPSLKKDLSGDNVTQINDNTFLKVIDGIRYTRYVQGGRKGLFVIVWPWKRMARGPGQMPTPQEWWLDSSMHARWSFLKAKYAEQNLDIARSMNRSCPNCGGEGVRDFISMGPCAKDQAFQTHPCPACRGRTTYKEIRYH